MTNLAEETSTHLQKLHRVREQIKRAIVGQDDVIDLVLMALLCEGHVLLEGVPGLGKTMLVRALGQALSLEFSRIQFTPDLMPADILGTSIVVQEDGGGFDLRFERGPVFANLLLADEINRASPKTQSALLEVMQERAVTIRGERHVVPRPFQVLATQNPLEMEGTYPLPEAQVDRFLLKILVFHPSKEELISIVERTVGIETDVPDAVLDAEEVIALQRAARSVVAPPQAIGYAARLVMATQPERETSPEKVRRFVRFGAGPRGAQALVLAGKARALMKGRFNLSLDDVKSLIGPALRHRIALNYEGQSEGIDLDELLATILQQVPADDASPAGIRS